MILSLFLFIIGSKSIKKHFPDFPREPKDIDIIGNDNGEQYDVQESPMYKKVLKDGAEVDVCENKFNSLSFNEKFNLVIEEVMVMALERYGDIYYKSAFNRMLKKFILNHAPIWESIWIIENHKYILTNIPFNFIEFLNQEIESSKLIA